MTWISLVCFLALSSSAFSFQDQQGGYGASVPQINSLLTAMRDNTLRRSMLPTDSLGAMQFPRKTLEQPSLGRQGQIGWPSGYGSTPLSLPKTLPIQSYGGALPKSLPVPQPPPVIVTEADNLCRGKAPETIIPLDGGRRFVVCLDNGKGAEQFCPKGLFYHLATKRCERKNGPPNYCSSQPCLNGGQCIPTETSYQCQCSPGFNGRNCEMDSRICETQLPCGNSPDARCQSFRLGAALTYICIFDSRAAYGLSPQQAMPSPCDGVDGPHALAMSNKGFIMCDAEQWFVESCPGGTVWDDNSKACSWPDVQIDTPKVDNSFSYGPSRPLISTPSSGSFQQPKLDQRFATQIPVRQPVPEQQTLNQRFSAQNPIRQPVTGQQTLGQGFTAQNPIRQPVTGQQAVGQRFAPQNPIRQPVPEQQTLGQGVAPQSPIQQSVPEQQTFNQEFAAQVPIRQSVSEQQTVGQGFGAQSPIQQSVPEQQTVGQGFAARSPIRQSVPEQQILNQEFAAQAPIRQPVPEQQTVGQGFASQSPIRQPVPEQQTVGQGFAAQSPIQQSVPEQQTFN